MNLTGTLFNEFMLAGLMMLRIPTMELKDVLVVIIEGAMERMKW
jgi:hypothetical protein